MISELSIDAFSLFDWNHGRFLSDFFGSGFVHGFSKLLLELCVLLALVLSLVSLNRVHFIDVMIETKGYKIKFITFIKSLRLYIFPMDRLTYQQAIYHDANSKQHSSKSIDLNFKQLRFEIKQKTLSEEMDRSQVRQFGMNRSIYSSKIMGMSSVLHSPRSNTERQLHLRKSRIANIPDTKNIDLSQKLDFVVVFQTIQIERMSQEIQTLRVRIKQYQRQLFNCDNYEIQIKELTERCFRLQSEKNSYREELFQNRQASEMIFNELQEIKKKYVTVDFTTNEKYKLERGRNDQLVLEVEKWKARYNALDQSKSKELQSIKRMMEEQSKSHLSRQTKELFDRFQLEKQQMERLIKTLKQSNIEKQTELKKIKFEFDNKDKLLDQMEKQVDQYEEKVALLSQQNYRLSELSKSKQNEINRLKDKLKQNQETSITTAQQISVKSEQNKKLSLKIKKIEELANQKEGKLSKLQKMSLIDKERLSELDRIVFLLKQRQNEIQSKTKMLERKDKKIVSMQQSIKTFQQTQNTTRTQINNLKKQSLLASQTITQLLSRIEQLTFVIQKVKEAVKISFEKMETHNTSFREEINKKTQRIIEYSHKLMDEIRENEQYIARLQNLAEENAVTIETLQNEKVSSLQKIQQLRQVQIQYEHLQQQNGRLKLKIDHLLQQKRELIEETEMKQSLIMNQTQKQIQTIEDNYQNNIIRNLKDQIQKKVAYISETQNNLNLTNQELKELQKEGIRKEQNFKKAMEIKQTQFLSRLQLISNQLQSKHQSLVKEQNHSQQIKGSLQAFIRFYQSHIKLQIQSLMNRIHPIQNAIRIIKSVVSERLIKEQKKFSQKQKHNETKINELIELNITLMERNNKLYEMLVAGNGIDTKVLYGNSKQIKKINEESQYTAIDSIYTLNNNNGSGKSISSPRGTNENFNTSNIVGMGSKIKQAIKGNFNNETSSVIPVEFLIKHVMVCTELQSLRQRIGDKNAKVQKMKNSLMVSNVSTNKSFVAVVNGNGKGTTQNILQPHGQMMLQSNLMSTTLINRLNNPFVNSIVGSVNNQHSFIHQSRLIEATQRTNGHESQLNVRRVISEERYPQNTSPDSSSILQNSRHKNMGIYTKRMSSPTAGIGRNGFKSIGIKKANIYN